VPDIGGSRRVKALSRSVARESSEAYSDAQWNLDVAPRGGLRVIDDLLDMPSRVRVLIDFLMAHFGPDAAQN
jgi:hypothetical protein